MASISLETVWFNDAADLADLLAIESVTGIEADPTQAGEVRTYAGGRQRLVTTSARPQSMSLSFGLVGRSACRWLEAHMGRALLYRDPLGRKFYGTYLAPKFVERRGENAADVSLTFQQVTYSESV